MSRDVAVDPFARLSLRVVQTSARSAVRLLDVGSPSAVARALVSSFDSSASFPSIQTMPGALPPRAAGESHDPLDCIVADVAHGDDDGRHVRQAVGDREGRARVDRVVRAVEVCLELLVLGALRLDVRLDGVDAVLETGHRGLAEDAVAHHDADREREEHRDE